PSAHSPDGPLAALDGVIRQAAVLARAAREQAASLDPARVRAQVAEAEAARRRAAAAAVTSEARAAETTAEAQAQAEAPEAAREDARAAQAGHGPSTLSCEAGRAGCASIGGFAQREATQAPPMLRVPPARSLPDMSGMRHDGRGRPSAN